MKKKRYTIDDLNNQFREIYNFITFIPFVDIGEESDEEINPYDEEDNDENDNYEESLLFTYIFEKNILKSELSNAIAMYKSDVYNDEFSIAIGKMGGKIGGLKRKFIQSCKIFVIHKLFPDSRFSGNALIAISETLFERGINRSFLHDNGYALGADGLFSGKSDTYDITDEQKEQARILMKILKKIS